LFQRRDEKRALLPHARPIDVLVIDRVTLHTAQ
jgi:hypothetical protein